MTDLINEFDEKRYPFRYRLIVGEREATRLRTWLEIAVKKLGLDAAFAIRWNDRHSDAQRRNTFDIGIGLTREADYVLLLAEIDQLAQSLERQSGSAHEQNHDSELLAAYAEQVACDKASRRRSKDQCLEHDDLSLVHG